MNNENENERLDVLVSLLEGISADAKATRESLNAMRADARAARAEVQQMSAALEPLRTETDPGFHFAVLLFYFCGMNNIVSDDLIAAKNALSLEDIGMAYTLSADCPYHLGATHNAAARKVLGLPEADDVEAQEQAIEEWVNATTKQWEAMQ